MGDVAFSRVENSVDRDYTAEQFLAQVRELVNWVNAHSDRAQQKMVGPSTLGEPCRRRLAYQIAGMEPARTGGDPWAAIVGTAVHTWLTQAFAKYQEHFGLDRWVTECNVLIDNLIPGTCDLYDSYTHTVWDFKTASPERLRDMKKNGPDEAYWTQVHLYGLGMSQAEYRVDHVGLILLPRSGRLANAWPVQQPYRPHVAQEALDRAYDIVNQLRELDVTQHPTQIHAVPASPSIRCGHCPFYGQHEHFCPAE